MNFTFPAELGLSSRDAVVDTRLEANWFAGKILDLTDGGPDEVEGRLPILITSDYWDADQHRTDTAIYDVVWRIEGRLLRGRMQIGRAHVCTPVTNAHLVCRLVL